MKHSIFVPWDGSDCAKRALEYAIRMAAGRPGSTIHVAYAHEEPFLYGEIAVYVPRDKILQSQAEHGRAVLQPAEAILKAAGVPYQAETLTGPIAKVLAERASSLGCESIVMGTHGRDTAGKLLAGSIATKVVHLSELPVTLVK